VCKKRDKGVRGKDMGQRDNDLDIGHLFRVIFLQGGQVAIGTAIGAGVLLLVGIVAVLLSPIWLPIFAVVYWQKERQRKKAAPDPALVGRPSDGDAGLTGSSAPVEGGPGSA